MGQSTIGMLSLKTILLIFLRKISKKYFQSPAHSISCIQNSKKLITKQQILVLSDISYVLYLTHQFIGFGIIYNMENGGIIGEKWIIIPMLHACLLALFLHYVVEANINKKIKKLCK